MAILEDDGALRDLLERTRTIAVLGIKSGEADDAYDVPRYLQRVGYRILAVNPKLDRVLGCDVVDRIGALGLPVDLVDVFRDARHLPGHVDEILSLDPLPRAVWLQRGIRDDDSAARLCDAGIDVVQDRCLMVEHARLLGAAGVGVATAPQPELLRVRVRVDYDFASSLCYVAHRCMERLKAPLEELGIRLDWSPLDLTRITGWRRGAEMDEIRRANVRRVARELCVPLVIPRTWQDWRRAHAVALLAPPEREATWRERVWSAVYEEGRELAADALAAELGLALSDEALTAGLERLEERTRSAAEQEVTGVPNFMLGAWPFGGIQTDETMLSILGRFASKHREGAQA